MGTKLQELRDGCFARAMDNEPMFVLLARDAGAPDKVRRWADERKREVDEGKRSSNELPQILEAYRTADRMEDWRIKNDGEWRKGLFAGAKDGGDAPMTVPHTGRERG